MRDVVKSYCLTCDWEISGADHTTEERTKAMIDHALTTGHDIESVTRLDEDSTDTTAASTVSVDDSTHPDDHRP